MLALGLVLLVLAAIAVTAALLGGSNDRATFDLGIFDVETNTLGVFLVGVTTALLLVVGLELVRSGIRRSNRRRREHRELSTLAEETGAREAGPSTTAVEGPGHAAGPEDRRDP